MATPSSNHVNSPFLRLPGEIRNTIYRLALIPSGKTILVINHPRPRPVGFTVLDLQIFRVSHQVRAEAASNLCTEKRFEIIGIKSANIVFACLGGALKSLSRLTIVSPTEQNAPAEQEVLEKFFEFMNKAIELKEFRLEVGKVHPRNRLRSGAADDWQLLENVRDWVLGKKEVQFEWCTPRVETRPGLLLAHRRRVEALRVLFGVEDEAKDNGTLQIFW